MADIYVFPHARRVGYIRRQAASAATAKIGTDAYLRTILQKRRAALKRIGIPDDVIATELRTAECAIRAHMWRLVLLDPPGAT
jgi:hypothetical protein